MLSPTTDPGAGPQRSGAVQALLRPCKAWVLYLACEKGSVEGGLRGRARQHHCASCPGPGASTAHPDPWPPPPGRRAQYAPTSQERTRRQHPGKPDHVPTAPEMEMAELRLDPGGRPEALEMLDVQCSVTLRASGPGNLEGRPAGRPEVTGDGLNGARSPGACPRRGSRPQRALLSLSEVLLPLRLGEGLGHPRPSSVCRGSTPGVQHPPPTLHPPPAHLPCGTHGVLPGSSLAGGRGG